jgi:hypothetical protein
MTKCEIKKQATHTSDGLSIAYNVKIEGGGENVIQLSSGFEIPRALHKDFAAAADADFPALFDRLVAKPLATAVSCFLQRKFEDLQREKI